MSLYLWPPVPIPAVDVLILIVSAVGVVAAVARFVYDLRREPRLIDPPDLPTPASSIDPTV